MATPIQSYNTFQSSPSARKTTKAGILPPKRVSKAVKVCKRCNKRVCGCATGCKCSTPML